MIEFFERIDRIDSVGGRLAPTDEHGDTGHREHAEQPGTGQQGVARGPGDVVGVGEDLLPRLQRGSRPSGWITRADGVGVAGVGVALVDERRRRVGVGQLEVQDVRERAVVFRQVADAPLGRPDQARGGAHLWRTPRSAARDRRRVHGGRPAGDRGGDGDAGDPERPAVQRDQITCVRRPSPQVVVATVEPVGVPSVVDVQVVAVWWCLLSSSSHPMPPQPAHPHGAVRVEPHRARRGLRQRLRRPPVRLTDRSHRTAPEPITP